MNKSVLSILSVGILTLSISSLGVACGAPGKLVKSLGLDSDQQERVATLFEQHKTARTALKEKRKILKKQYHELAINYTEAMANQVALQTGELAKERAYSKIQYQQQMLGILNDDQKTKYLKLIQKRGMKQGRHEHYLED